MRVPTCQLQHGFGQDAQGIVPYPRYQIELQQDAESFYGRRGVNILATCTLQHLDINTLGIVWARTPANYEDISQVLAAMEVIAADGTVTLYHA